MSDMIDKKRREGESIEHIAENDKTVLKNLVDDKYPSFEERELLAGALFKKYLDKDSEYNKEYSKLYDESEQNATYRVPDKLRIMQKVRDRASETVRYFTALNDIEFNKAEKKISDEKLNDMSELRKKVEAEKRDRQRMIVNRFAHEHTDIPRTEGARMSLKDWAEKISEYKFRVDIPHEASEHYDKSTEEFRDMFNGQYTHDDQEIISGEINAELHHAIKELHQAQSALLHHEPSFEEKEHLKATDELVQKLELLSRFIRFIITTS
jgi:hypothetical protein